MSKLKIAELAISSISALVTIAKAMVKFIDYIGKLTKRTPAIGMA